MNPENRIRPGGNRADSKQTNCGGGLTDSLRQEPDKPSQPAGCPCGHFYDQDCTRHQPLPTIVGCGACQALDLDQREAAARRKIFCGPSSCARQLLGV